VELVLNHRIGAVVEVERREPSDDVHLTYAVPPLPVTQRKLEAATHEAKAARAAMENEQQRRLAEEEAGELPW
jgi:hypothetical protein